METAKKMDQCTYKRFSKDRVARIWVQKIAFLQDFIFVKILFSKIL